MKLTNRFHLTAQQRVGLWLWLTLSLCACSSLPARHFPLADSPASWVAQQQWQLTYRHSHYSLQVIIEAAPDHWQWIMLNSLGQRLATANIRNGMLTLSQQQAHPANKLLPELLQAVQFSYWPVSDLQRQGGGQWRFASRAKHREIYFRDILHATIDYESETPEQGELNYQNKDSDFQLVIASQRLN